MIIYSNTTPFIALSSIDQLDMLPKIFGKVTLEPCPLNLASKIYIAGHRGLADSAIVRELQRQGYTNLVYRNY